MVPLRGVHRNRDGFHRSRSSAVLARRGISARSEGLARLRDPLPRNLLVDVLVLPELPDLRVVEGHQSDDLLGAGVPGLLDVQAVLEVLHAGDEVRYRLRLAIQDVPDLCGVRVLRFLEVPEVVVDSLEDVLEVLHERIPVAYRLARI